MSWNPFRRFAGPWQHPANPTFSPATSGLRGPPTEDRLEDSASHCLRARASSSGRALCCTSNPRFRPPFTCASSLGPLSFRRHIDALNLELGGEVASLALLVPLGRLRSKRPKVSRSTLQLHQDPTRKVRGENEPIRLRRERFKSASRSPPARTERKLEDVLGQSEW